MGVNLWFISVSNFFFFNFYEGEPVFQQIHVSIGSALDFDTDDNQCAAIMGTSSGMSKRSLDVKKVKGFLFCTHVFDFLFFCGFEKRIFE